MTRGLRAALAATLLAGTLAIPAANAGEPYDGTTLTPPVRAGTPCSADGRWVRCDTSFITTFVNTPAFELPCGLFYETATDDRHATRWYEDGLLVKRSVQASYRGTWSLSPTGAGPRVSVQGDWNWWIHLSTPGDESTQTLTSHGNATRVDGIQHTLRDVGHWFVDGAHAGQFSFDDAGFIELCKVLAP